MTTFARPSTPFPHMPAPGAGSYFAFAPMPSVAPITEAQPIASSSRNTSTSTSTARFSRPLHFALPALPTRTPPSLLKRSASSASSSSASSLSEERDVKVARPTPASPGLSSTPPLAERRTSSSSSSSSSSSEASSPATPPHSMHLQLPAQPSYFRSVPTKPSYSYAAFPEFESLDETPLTAVELLTDDAYDLARAQAADFYSAASAPYPSPAPQSYPAAYYPTTTAPRPKSPTRPKLKRRDTPRPVETISTLTAISLSYEGRKGMSAIEEAQARRYTSMVDGGQWVVVA